MMASPPSAGVSTSDIIEGLRRVVDAQIGPRSEGTIYENSDGTFQVLEVIRDPERARELLRRRCAQWALIVKNLCRSDGLPFAVGTVWTTCDHLVREACDRQTGGGER